MRAGIVRWIGVRPARRAPMVAVGAAMLDVGHGVIGDRWDGRPGGGRMVTLIGKEQLAAIASFLGRAVAPDDLRRNVVLAGINLAALKERRLRLGTAVLEVTGDCHPCSRMEQILGPGGYNAVRGHGGLTARVISPGEVRLGDAAERILDQR